jgi:hypothetical protein
LLHPLSLHRAPRRKCCHSLRGISLLSACVCMRPSAHTHTHTQMPGFLALSDARGGVRVREIRGHVACVEAAKRPREKASKSQRQHACFLRHVHKRPDKSTALGVFQLKKSRCTHGRVSRCKASELDASVEGMLNARCFIHAQRSLLHPERSLLHPERSLLHPECPCRPGINHKGACGALDVSLDQASGISIKHLASSAT